MIVFPHLNIGFSLMVNAESCAINELATKFIDRLLEYKRDKIILAATF